MQQEEIVEDSANISDKFVCKTIKQLILFPRELKPADQAKRVEY